MRWTIPVTVSVAGPSTRAAEAVEVALIPLPSLLWNDTRIGVADAVDRVSAGGLDRVPFPWRSEVDAGELASTQMAARM